MRHLSLIFVFCVSSCRRPQRVSSVANTMNPIQIYQDIARATSLYYFFADAGVVWNNFSLFVSLAGQAISCYDCSIFLAFTWHLALETCSQAFGVGQI